MAKKRYEAKQPAVAPVEPMPLTAQMKQFRVNVMAALGAMIADVPVYIRGDHGLGKTASFETFALDILKVPFQRIFGNTIDKPDLVGYPKEKPDKDIVTIMGRTVRPMDFCPPEQLVRLAIAAASRYKDLTGEDLPDRFNPDVIPPVLAIFGMEEFDTMSEDTAKAARSVVNEREAGLLKLPVRILACGNQSEQYVSRLLDGPLSNRFWHGGWCSPGSVAHRPGSSAEWLEVETAWAEFLPTVDKINAQLPQARADFRRFARECPDAFKDIKIGGADGLTEAQMQFAHQTPRSEQIFVRMMALSAALREHYLENSQSARAQGLLAGEWAAVKTLKPGDIDKITSQLLTGACGKELYQKYVQWSRFKIPAVEKVIQDPNGTVVPDKSWDFLALSHNLGAYLAELSDAKQFKSACSAIGIYFSRVQDQARLMSVLHEFADVAVARGIQLDEIFPSALIQRAQRHLVGTKGNTPDWKQQNTAIDDGGEEAEA